MVSHGGGLGRCMLVLHKNNTSGSKITTMKRKVLPYNFLLLYFFTPQDPFFLL
jgi:hypothetical protein